MALKTFSRRIVSESVSVRVWSLTELWELKINNKYRTLPTSTGCLVFWKLLTLHHTSSTLITP